MIPYDVDPTLHNTQPHKVPDLDDGFSPPPADEEIEQQSLADGEPELGTQSSF